MVVRSDRSGSAVLSDATGRLLNAGREGTLTSNEQDARKAPSRTYLRTLRFATRGWLNSTAIQVEIGIRSESESVGQSRKFSRLRFWLMYSGDGVELYLADHFYL